jgi:hypothetical protein
MRCLPVILIILFCLSLAGCASENLEGTLPDNEPPIVWLAIAPPQGWTVNYRIHAFWGGWDPDGDIAYFEYAITDNETGVFQPADTTGSDNWSRVNAGDSVFVFSADLLADSSSVDPEVMDTFLYRRTHTFFIRAVDQKGALSNVAYRSFTASTLSPVVSIHTPRDTRLGFVQVAAVPTFGWRGTDFVGRLSETQEPESVRTILVSTRGFAADFDKTTQYIRENPDAPEWTDWKYYKAPGDTGKFWHPENPLAFGTYVFAVQVKDEAGAVNPVFDVDRNMRRIRVSHLPTGPQLTVTNRFLGSLVTSSPSTSPAILDIPAGMPMTFSWKADASSYGGYVVAYRYGWDILDLNDDEQWPGDITPFTGLWARSQPRTFEFGTHTFHVEVVDNSGLKSRASVSVNMIPFTMEREVLVVDDWLEGTSPGFRSTKGALPNDFEHDEFWADVLSDVEGFVPGIDIFPAKGKLFFLPITVAAKYKAIIWNVRGHPTFNVPSLLGKTIRFGLGEFNILTLYMEAGGKILICGQNPMTTVINKTIFPDEGRRHGGKGVRYPVIFRYELGGNQRGSTEPDGEESFGYDECCLNLLDVAYGIHVHRFVCPVSALKDFDLKTEGLRACNSIDETYDFPRLELRPEVSDVGKFYHEDAIGLNCDIYNPPYFGETCDLAELSPPRDCFQPMYGLECLNQSAVTFGAPIAFWTSRYADVPDVHGIAARSAVWGFEPVYFKPDQVREALGIILFDEWQLSRK